MKIDLFFIELDIRLFKGDTVDGVTDAFQHSVDRLKKVEDEQREKGRKAEAKAAAELEKAVAFRREANRAASVSERIGALIK